MSGVGVLLAGLLAACGDSGSSGEAKTTTQAEGKETKTIAVLLPAVGDAWWSDLSYGIIDEAKKHGFNIELSAGAGFGSPEEQVTQLERAEQSDPDMVIVETLWPDAVRAPLDRLIAKGVSVLTLATAIGYPNELHAGLNDQQLGYEVADILGEAANGQELRLFELPGPAGASWSELRMRFAEERLKEKYPDVVVAHKRYTSLDPVEAGAAAMNILQGDPEIDYIYTSSGMIPGIRDALRQLNLDGKVHIVSGNLSRDAVQGLKENKIDAVVSESPVDLGRVAIGMAAEILDGKTPKSPQYAVVKVFTPDNIGTSDLSTEFAPDGYKMPVG